MDVLACPFCDRMFHATPAILGKAIRCRGCRQAFRVPRDPATAELGPETDVPQPEIRIAVECVVEGVDARRCPACSHTFAMQPRFAGVRIRCRGCQVPFVVLASTRVPGSPASAQPTAAADPAGDSAATPLSTPEPSSVAADVAHEPEPADDASPLIHEDGGDVLHVEPADEPVVVAVRPRACWRSRVTYEPVRGPFRSGQF